MTNISRRGLFRLLSGALAGGAVALPAAGRITRKCNWRFPIPYKTGTQGEVARFGGVPTYPIQVRCSKLFPISAREQDEMTILGGQWAYRHWTAEEIAERARLYAKMPVLTGTRGELMNRLGEVSRRWLAERGL